jgi:rhodanese-related sulfurtransferase
MTRFAAILFILLSATLALSGCSVFDQLKNTNDTDIVALQVTYEQLQDMLAAPAGQTILLDIRSEKKYAAAHIPPAINIPIPQIAESDPRLGEASSVVVYGEGLTDFNNLAGVAAKKMLRLHYSNVSVYQGGLKDWQEHGNAVAGTQSASTRPAGR